MSKPAETDVLIVGSGPAGAAAAVALAQAGVKNTVINRYRSTSPGPRAHITNQRTMEILRDFGIEEAAKKLATPWELMGEHAYATSLVGEELGRIPAWGTSDAARSAQLKASPTTYCDLPQLYLEPLLVAEASQRGSDLRFRTEYLSHVQDAEGVTARLADHVSGLEYEVRARYLIGADGARSKVAQDIGLSFEGELAFGESGSVNIEFTADLSAFCAHRPSDMYWILQVGRGLNGPAAGPGFGVMRMIRPWNKWMCVVGYELAGGVHRPTDQEAREMVCRILGTHTVPIQIDAIGHWANNRQYALNNTNGRVFCMGDAVHRHTPFGGLGMNTSIQDAYNLAWKLALVLKGQAGPALLASYEAERAPIARQVVEHAFQSTLTLGPLFQALELPPGACEQDMEHALARLKEPSADGARMRKSLRQAMDKTLDGFGAAHGVELNQRYVSSAIVADGTADPGFSRDPVYFYQPSTRPGAHLPHAWLTCLQRKVSTLDLCGKGRFTLLTGLAGQAWAETVAMAAHELGIDLHMHVIGPGQEYVDSHGDWARVSGLDEAGALLVRPDMFIAWRAADCSSASRDGLVPAVLQILGR
ncbi:FAD-dependent monooxygenase [Delftia deserti]|uniref:FAD-dependent monooxygenase n=1 Tax=Delftia deserti TaxID=1651218 RepID=A0ABW5EQD4_9BURK